jgi:hypothetical protein
MLTNEQLRKKYGGTQSSGTSSGVSAPTNATNKKSLQWSDAVDAAKNFAIGGIKGLGSTILGIGELGTKTIGRLGGVNVKETSRFAQEQRQTTLKPVGTAQKVGFGAEQIAEFFVPAGAAGKVAKGAEVASQASKISKLGNFALRNSDRIITQAAGDVAVSAGQSGGNIKTMADTAKFSLAGGILGHVAARGLKNFGNVLFLRTVPGTGKQLANDIKKGIDVGEALSKTGISLTRGQLLGKVASRVSSLTNKVDEAVGAVGSKFSRSFDQVATDTENLLKDKDIAKVLEATPINIDSVRETVTETLQKYRNKYAGKVLTAADQHQLKQDIGVGLGRVWDKMLSTPIRAEAFTESKIYNALNSFLRENIDGYETLNRQLAPLREGVKRATEKGTYSGYLTDVIAASLAGSTGGNILEDPKGFLESALGGVLIKRGVTSTASKTIIGTLIKKIGSALDTPAFFQFLRMATSDGAKDSSTNAQYPQ